MTANDIGVTAPALGRRRVHRPALPTRRGVRRSYDTGRPRLLPDDARRPLAAYAASLAVTLTTAWVALVTSGGTDRGRGPWPRLPLGTGGILRVLGRWDSAWYIRLAGRGYPDAATFAHDARLGAFYPVLPGLMRATTAVTGLPPAAIGVAISVASGAAAVLVVWQLTRELAGRAAADRAAALIAFFPAAFVFAMPYTEGLAIATAGGAILATRRDRWVWAGLLGAMAVATRSNTIVIIPALAVAAWHQGRRAWTAPVLAALGVAATWLGMWSRTGDPLTWLHAEDRGWREHVDMGAGTLRHVWRVLHLTDISLRPAGLIDLTVALGLVLAVIGLVALWRWRPPLPVLLYGTGAIALAAASSVVGPRPRMVLGAFPLVMAVGVRFDGRAHRRILGLSVLCMVAMTWITFTTTAVAP